MKTNLDMRRCRHCGLDTILSEDIDDHEETCSENDLPTDAFDDWRDEDPGLDDWPPRNH